MVQSSTVINITEGGTPFAGIPHGKYTIVGIDIDTTGRRLIDEIVQLAAYTPNDHFEQYIMPYMNLNPAARQRHQVRVISIGFYRMLKSMQTYKIIKSKSEIAAIKDFLDWLESIKAKDANSQGIIMVYHEERKFIPYMILEALKKYNLLDRFANTVKSFANGLVLAKSVAAGSENFQQLSLRKLSSVLSATNGASNGNNSVGCGGGNSSDSDAGNAATITSTSTNNNNNKQVNENVGDGNKTIGEGESAAAAAGGAAAQSTPSTGGDNRQNRTASRQVNEREFFDGSAAVRARLAYEVALQLCNRDCKDVFQSPAAFEKLLQTILKLAYPIDVELKELETQNQNLERQNSFRPIFFNYFKTTLYHRVRAVKFRIILAEQGYDLQSLNAIWSEKQKPGLLEVLQTIEELKPEDKTELADLLDSHFDPNKTTIKPIVKNNNRRRNRRGPRSNRNDGNLNSRSSNSEQGAGGDKQNAAKNAIGQSPDSTSGGGGGGGQQGGGTNNAAGNQAGQSNKPTQTGSVGGNNGGNGGGGGGGKPQRNRRNQRSRNNSVKNRSSSVNIQVTPAPAAVAPVAVPMVATN